MNKTNIKNKKSIHEGQGIIFEKLLNYCDYIGGGYFKFYYSEGEPYYEVSIGEYCVENSEIYHKKIIGLDYLIEEIIELTKYDKEKIKKFFEQ